MPSGSVDAVPSKVTVCPTIGLVGVKVNDAIGARSVIDFVPVVCAVLPLSSVTVSVTVYEPALV